MISTSLILKNNYFLVITTFLIKIHQTVLFFLNFIIISKIQEFQAFYQLKIT